MNMNTQTLDDILARVNGPSRYMGSEVNAVFKDPSTVKLHMALAFPDLYDIGTSHFGLQILYHILNRETEIYAERVFAPANDMSEILSQKKLPLFSLETATPLSKFDVIGFSLLYELNYTNILLMLESAGLPFYAASRNETHPLIIAGGPCTVNPEPVADFFDAMVIGDGETVILEMAKAAISWKNENRSDRQALLKAWSRIEGVYVPSLFEVSYDQQGRQILSPRLAGYERITRAIVEDLDCAAFPDAPVLAFGKPVHDRLRLEIARGCTRGCRFCQAGMIYRPLRERSLDRISKLTEQNIRTTGYDDVSLLSLSTGDYSCLSPLMAHLMKRYGDQKIAISIPSFRAGTLTRELMDQIKTVRKTGFTIAPEAGSERLRRVINKNISETEILQTTSSAFDLGWNLVKLYFMIGLPTETDDDLKEIVRLVKTLKKSGPSGKRRFNINASVATFIPKSHTPFQWAGQIDLKTAKDKIERLRRELKLPGIGFKWQNPETSHIEGLFARGDRRLSRLIVAAYENGCRFDGWTDAFQYSKWKEAIDHMDFDPDTDFTKPVAPGKPLPWDHIDTRISTHFLREEYDKAMGEQSTGDCRIDECQGCGVCNFDTIIPRIACPDGLATPITNTDNEEIKLVSEAAETSPQEIRLKFRRTGRARFFSHLEQVNIFSRAFNRVGLPVVFSVGFHPKPKIVFGDALPVGVESHAEDLFVTVNGPVQPDKITSELNNELPRGLEINSCTLVGRKEAGQPPPFLTYSACMVDEPFDPDRIDRFRKAETFMYTRETKKGKEKSVDMKDQVLSIAQTAPGTVLLQLDNRPGSGIRPAKALRAIFDLTDNQIAGIRIIKLS